MKQITIIANLLGREELSRDVIEANIRNAGVPRKEIYLHLTMQEAGKHSNEFQEWAVDFSDKLTLNRENTGNPQALNVAVGKAMKGDTPYIAIMGNDILMPPEWVKTAIFAAENYKPSSRQRGVGIVSWPERANQFPTNAMMTVKSGGTIGTTEFLQATAQTRGNFQYSLGTWVFHRNVRYRVGSFLEASKYGMWDGRYYLRVLEAGYVNLVLCKQPFIHKGAKITDMEYHKFKQEEAKKARDAIRELPKITSERFYLSSDQVYYPEYHPAIDLVREGRNTQNEEE